MLGDLPLPIGPNHGHDACAVGGAAKRDARQPAVYVVVAGNRYDVKTATQLVHRDRQLTSLPSTVAQLTNLTKLDVSSCGLTSLPDTIAKLINLTELLGEHGLRGSVVVKRWCQQLLRIYNQHFTSPGLN